MASRGYWLSVIQVSGGVVIGQLIGITGFLFLTWIYRPAEFGVYAAWLSVVMIGSVLCTGALETSLVRDDDGAARREAAASIVWTAMLGAARGCARCADAKCPCLSSRRQCVQGAAKTKWNLCRHPWRRGLSGP